MKNSLKEIWMKRVVCVLLVMCAVTLAAAAGAQDIFSGAVVESGTRDYDDGSYDPSSEEDLDAEEILESAGSAVTPAPIMQSEYAGATPVVIDPIDKPTPTPLPTLTFTYDTYDASALHMTFEAPIGWMVDDSEPDSYTITNPDPSMDYAARETIREVPVNRAYDKKDLTKEIRGALDTIRSDGNFKTFNPSNTATRTLLGETGVYANYSGVNGDGIHVAGRIIAVCVNKTLYILHCSYPQGYTDTYVAALFNRFRSTVKMH